MADKIDRTVQEDFIWAMRTRDLVLIEEDDLWTTQDAPVPPIQAYDIVTMSPEQDRQNETIRIYASLLPDEIIYDCRKAAFKKGECSVMIIKFDEYTKLCESFAGGNLFTLTNILNKYIGNLVQEIVTYNGDVIHCSLECIIGMWRVGTTTNAYLQDCVHQALDCGLIIYKSHDSYRTEFGYSLSAQIAVTVGSVVIAVLGSQDMSRYVPMGLPLWELRKLEMKDTGEVYMSQTAWENVNRTYYQYHRSEKYWLKIIGISRQWRSSHKDSRRVRNMSSDCSILDDGIFEIRDSIRYAIKHKIDDELRRFFNPAILRAMDMNETLEYITGVRSVVIIIFRLEIHNRGFQQLTQQINRSFEIISNIIVPKSGCINRLDVNEEDFTIEAIFGLRGYKVQMDSQIALQCANQCLDEFSELRNKSAAVTTGLCYCGTVGHSLRREYTVIGVSTIKAYELSAVHQNRVICDRETFLYSGLDARYFYLQEPVDLTGVLYVGPIYEYSISLEYVTKPRTYPISKYPLLNRDNEISTYKKMLVNLLKVNQLDQEKRQKTRSVLVFTGEQRLGKTRLSEEIVYITDADIPICPIKLHTRDKEIPYEIFMLIFTVPLGLTDDSTIEDRETRIRSKLKDLPVPALLCVLNPIFLVKFPLTKVYQSLSSRRKELAQMKVLKQLCYACFKRLWVMVIDEAQYIDDKSWPLLMELVNTNLIFFVLAMTREEALRDEIHDFLKNEKVSTVKLKIIEKWYHVGMACQLLDVQAISPELEKAMDVNCSGNPGWMENYLVSLVESGDLKIMHINASDVDDYGLLFPPAEMISRANIKDFFSTCSSISSTTNGSDGLKYASNKWKLYKYIYQGNKIALANRSRSVISVSSNANRIDPSKDTVEKEGAEQIELNIKICLVMPNANLNVIDIHTIGVRIMRVFDSLSSYEQLILKCSSVIGDYFTRDMLLYIMATLNEPKKTGLAIQRLFEIDVLRCAHGDFVSRGANAILNSPSVNPKDPDTVDCMCVGLRIPDEYFRLPKYASCGYMRFKMSAFRDSTYSLLSEYERRELHAKAVRYLEKKTRKCRKCGEGLFTRIMGNRYEDDRNVQVTRDVVKKASPKTVTGGRSSKTKSHISIRSGRSRKNFNAPEGDVESLNSASVSESAMSDNISRMKTLSFLSSFSDTDFNGCECAKILDSMYKQILYHCEGADMVVKLISATIEYAELCVVMCNVPYALNILTKGMAVLDEKHDQIITKPGEKWKGAIKRGRILSIMGKAKLHLGFLPEALDCLKEALKEFDCNFPGPIRMKMIKFSLMRCQWWRKNRSKPLDHLNYYDSVADCWTLIYETYIKLGMLVQAKTAAMMSLVSALHSRKDFITLTTSYANLLHTSLLLKDTALIEFIEIKSAMHTRRFKNLDVNELKATLFLYTMIYASRFRMGDLARGHNIGTKCCAIVQAIPNKTILLAILPIHFHVLILKLKVLEAATTLIGMDYSSYPEDINEGQTWFYALSICFHLETGYIIIPFQECVGYGTEFYIHLHNTVSTRRLSTVIWLWYMRNCEFESAEIWESRVISMMQSIKYFTITETFTYLYYMEGLCLLATEMHNRKDLDGIDRLYQLIDNLIVVLSKEATFMKVMLPRFNLYRAYYTLSRYNDTSYVEFLKKAKSAAYSQNNSYDEEWIKHSELAWTNMLGSLDQMFWKEHATDDAFDYQDLEQNECQLGLYTLEPPIYTL